MLHSSPFYSLSLSLKYSLFPKSHLDWVYVPPQAQYSMYKAREGGGGGAALMVAEEDTTWAQQAERSEWKPLDPF